MTLHISTQGNGPDLILLHGWGFNSAVWDKLLPKLIAHYRVSCVDLPGFGKSRNCHEFNTLAEIADAILTAIKQPAIYMGWSMGGLIGQFIAAHYPKQVTELINICTSPCFIRTGDWPGIDREALIRFGKELREDYQKTLQRFLILQLHGCDYSRDEFKDLQKKLFDHPADQAALDAGLRILLDSDLRTEIAKINCPNRYILGRLDALAPASLAEPLRLLLPQAHIEVIDKASHAPFISHLDQFLATTGLHYD